MSHYVLYHDDSDGIASALAAKLTPEWKDATYIAVQYGQPFPERVVLNESACILIVDFSYKREILEEVKRKAGAVLVIDHHSTAADELMGLCYTVFDEDESGATLTWKYLHGTEPPLLFQYVGDRDLWRFQFEQSRWLEHGVQGSGRSRDLSYWEELYRNKPLFNETLLIGKILHENLRGICASFVKSKKYRVLDWPSLRGGIPVKFALFNNTSLISEISEAVYTAEPDIEFVMSYFVNPANSDFVFSLRSAKDKEWHLGGFANAYGGGGHRHAAGFTMPLPVAAQFIGRITGKSVSLSSVVPCLQ